MTDITIEAPASTGGPRRSGALTAMRLAELQGLASSMGIDGTAKMRKGDLVAAIKARQNGDNVA
ncbi:MAG: Rho termination factor N-terminal domain-containing protein, partial [Phycicoccus sp.]